MPRGWLVRKEITIVEPRNAVIPVHWTFELTKLAEDRLDVLTKRQDNLRPNQQARRNRLQIEIEHLSYAVTIMKAEQDAMVVSLTKRLEADRIAQQNVSK